MKKTLIFLAVALASVGCTKTTVVSDNAGNSDRSLGFSAFTHKSMTKGSIDDLERIEAARTQYIMQSYQMTTVYADAGSIAKPFFQANFGYGLNTVDYPNDWNTENTRYWPKETVTENGIVATNSLSFFTFGPASATITYNQNNYSGHLDRTFPTLTVTVADNNAEQLDILAAMTEFKTYSADLTGPDANKVDIDYNHILSAVTFAANTKDTVVFHIKEIKVGVKPQVTDTIDVLLPTGTYGFKADNAKGEWTGQTGTPKSYEVGLKEYPESDGFVPVDSTDHSANVVINADDQVLLLIPQKIEEEGAYFAVTYEVYDNEGTLLDAEITKCAPLFATKLPEWLTGKKYNYIFTLRRDINHPIEYTVQVEDWEEQDVIEQFEGQYISDRDLPVYVDGGDEFDTDW